VGRTRKPIKMRQEKRGKVWVAYFRHPVRMRTERIALGDSQEPAQKRLEWLNRNFLNPEYWEQPHPNTPEEIRKAWLGPTGSVKIKKVIPDQGEIASLKMDVAFYKEEWGKAITRIRRLEKELEHWRGKKIRTGPCPTLGDACRLWLANYKGRDGDHTKIIGYDLWRFVDHFDPPKPGEEHGGDRMEVDELAGRERDIDAWLRGLTVKQKKEDKTPPRPIGAGRRAQIRRAVLRFLEDSGVSVARKAVTSVKKKEVRADRGRIRWLERDQAELVAEKLPSPWCDLFRVQVALGLRPDELITLKRDDFDNDLSRVALSPLKHLTLKQGSRQIRVPTAVQKIIKRRLEAGDVLFNEPETGEPWADPKNYNKQYNAALKKAAAAAGVLTHMDCRIGRRTCASLLLRNGRNVEEVAAILGDDPATIREHYASILPHEVDPTPAALKEKA